MARTDGAAQGAVNERNNTAVPEDAWPVGMIEPIVGGVANRDINGYFGFSIIKKGAVVTREIAERAQNMGRLYELIAATQDE